MPLYAQSAGAHTITQAAENILAHWNYHAEALNQSGVYFGKTAVATQARNSCTARVSILWYVFIWLFMAAGADGRSAYFLLQARFSQFEYRVGVRVIGFSQRADGQVEVALQQVVDQKEDKIVAKNYC